MSRTLGTRVNPEETYAWATEELERVIAEHRGQPVEQVVADQAVLFDSHGQ